MTTARALRGPFDYRLLHGLHAGVGVGSMLVVPFGRRQILGVVTAISDRSEVSEEKLLTPVRALDEGPPALPLDLVVLAEWLAEEYCSTLARALSLVLPPADGDAPVERTQTASRPASLCAHPGGSSHSPATGVDRRTGDRPI